MAKKPTHMDDREFLKILKDEETDASSYYTSELATAQAEAMERYHAEPFGDEIEGRSQVVMHDVEDTVNWVIPKLQKTFVASDELVTVEDESYTVDDDKTRCAGGFLQHVFFQDNPGEEIIHDFAFDALLQRIGIIRVGWEMPKPKPAKVIEGLMADQVVKYVQDSEYEILEQDSDVRDIDGQPAEVFTIKVVRTPAMGRVVVENIPPEEFAFSRRSRSMKHSDYHRWKREVFLADVITEYPDFEDRLLSGSTTSSSDDEQGANEDAREDARFPDEPSETERKDAYHKLRRKVWLIEEDIRVDYNNDGVTELRHVKRVGDVVLENEEIERSEFVEWSPIRVSHRMVGRSLTDTICDLQRIRTVIMRSSLDSLAQSLVPRHAYNSQLLDEDAIDALLDADIGGAVPVKGDVRQAIQPLVTPDLSATGLQMMEYIDQRSEEASGVTRHAQGLKAEAITDTKGGIENLQSAANERIELIARWLGHGLERVFQLILETVAMHQDQARMVKIKGRPLLIDPREWSDEMRVTVHVGMAAENRRTKLQILQGIADKQEQILIQAGPNNPVCGLPEYRNTLALMVEESGFKNVQRFFREVPEDYQPPEPGPDPKEAEAQAKLQIEEQKAVHNAKVKEAEFQHNSQMEQAKLANERQLAEMKAANERELAELRITAETEIAQRRIDAETALARWKTEQELEIKRTMGAAQIANGKSNGVSSHTDMGGKIG